MHRDLKSGNIFLVRSGGISAPPIPKLLDFGLAKTNAPVVSARGTTDATTLAGITAQGTIVGTFRYMAPEQIDGREADARTDIFAFGCVLYERCPSLNARQLRSYIYLGTARWFPTRTMCCRVRPRRFVTTTDIAD